MGCCAPLRCSTLRRGYLLRAAIITCALAAASPLARAFAPPAAPGIGDAQAFFAGLPPDLQETIEVLSRVAEMGDIDVIADYYSLPGTPLRAPGLAPHGGSGGIPVVSDSVSGITSTGSFFSGASPERSGGSLPAAGAPSDLTADKLSCPLEDELNYRATEEDISWKKRGTLYLFRDHRWYRDDAFEVPGPAGRDVIARCTAAAARGGGALDPMSEDVLDLAAAAASALTRRQIANGLPWLAADEGTVVSGASAGATASRPSPPRSSLSPLAQIASMMNKSYDFLRFYAGLPAGRQEALRAGRLPLASLTAEQVAAATRLSPPLAVACAAERHTSFLLGVGNAAGLPFNVRPGLVFARPAQ
jgi:hypothetical protein